MRMMTVEDGYHPDENVVALKTTLLTTLSCLTPTGETPRRIGRWGRRKAGPAGSTAVGDENQAMRRTTPHFFGLSLKNNEYFFYERIIGYICDMFSWSVG